MSRWLSPRRAAQAGAVALGVLVLAMLVLTVVLDSVTHYPGTGGPLVDSLAVAAAGIPAAAVATVLAARRPANPIGWLLFGILFTGVALATHVLPVKSAVAVAACTLITAALFNPVRRRVQRVVDRRFNRSRYNAEAVVAAFTARMRHTVDLDAARDDLAGVVHEAFQPAHVSVWLAMADGRAAAGAEPHPLPV